jgi:hypothetical protein
MITHKSIGYSGRLGNQMFQYAALKSIALLMNQNIVLPNNISIKEDGCYDFTNNKWIPYKLDLLDCFDLNCSFHNIPDDNGIIEIDGYFQSYKHFIGNEQYILDEFKFKAHILNKCTDIIGKYNNPVSIHVRRGDYVKHPNYWVVTPEYIQAALEQFSDNEYTFLIFSDDIQWCKEIFPEGVIFMEGNNQFEDLCLMSLCNHNIISNSTFSWWGAFLNKNKNKKVIAPRMWYSEYKDLSDLYPRQWLQL